MKPSGVPTKGAAKRRVRLWESVGMIGAVGTVIGAGIALAQPLFSPWRGLWHWLGGAIVIPAPFLAVLVIGFLALRAADRQDSGRQPERAANAR
jgi:hypothetical protein